MIPDLKKQERAAIEAVARGFSATWEDASAPGKAYLVIGGKRVAVEIATLKPRSTGRGRGAAQAKEPKLRLRFDKVVIWLIDHLQAALSKIVPEGTTVLLTITAPIRLPGKTAAALEDKTQTLLERGSQDRDAKDTIHGNRVQIRIVKHESTRAPKFIGFVHNPDSDPLLLLDMTSELLDIISAQGDRGATSRAGDRWLVLITAGGSSRLAAYRYICSQLRHASDFKKVLMIFGDGSVEVVTEQQPSWAAHSSVAR